MRNRTASTIVALALVVVGCSAQLSPSPTATRIFVQSGPTQQLTVRITSGTTTTYFAVPVGAMVEIPGNDPKAAVAIFDEQCVQRGFADERGVDLAVVFNETDTGLLSESPGSALPTGAPMASPTDGHC